MDAREFSPRRLKADDIPDEGVNVTFMEISRKEYDDGDKTLAIVTDEFPHYTFEPNVTQTNDLIGMFDWDTDNWIGRTVRLIKVKLTTGKFKGQYTLVVEPVLEEVAEAA